MPEENEAPREQNPSDLSALPTGLRLRGSDLRSRQAKPMTTAEVPMSIGTKGENQEEAVQTSPIGEDNANKGSEVTQKMATQEGNVVELIQSKSNEEEPHVVHDEVGTMRDKQESAPKSETILNNSAVWKEIQAKTPQKQAKNPNKSVPGQEDSVPKKKISGKSFANIGIVFAFLCFIPKPDLAPFIFGPFGVIFGLISYIKGEVKRSLATIVLSIIFSLISIFLLDIILNF